MKTRASKQILLMQSVADWILSLLICGGSQLCKEILKGVPPERLAIKQVTVGSWREGTGSKEVLGAERV